MSKLLRLGGLNDFSAQAKVPNRFYLKPVYRRLNRAVGDELGVGAATL